MTKGAPERAKYQIEASGAGWRVFEVFTNELLATCAFRDRAEMIRDTLNASAPSQDSAEARAAKALHEIHLLVSDGNWATYQDVVEAVRASRLPSQDSQEAAAAVDRFERAYSNWILSGTVDASAKAEYETAKAACLRTPAPSPRAADLEGGRILQRDMRCPRGHSDVRYTYASDTHGTIWCEECGAKHEMAFDGKIIGNALYRAWLAAHPPEDTPIEAAGLRADFDIDYGNGEIMHLSLYDGEEYLGSVKLEEKYLRDLHRRINAPGTPIEKAAREALTEAERVDTANIVDDYQRGFAVGKVAGLRASLSGLPQETRMVELASNPPGIVEVAPPVPAGKPEGFYDLAKNPAFDFWAHPSEDQAQEGAAGEGEPLPSVGGPSGLKMERTARGFVIGQFVDRYGAKCSLQKSSLATEDCIWLGSDEQPKKHMGEWLSSRMHLTQEMVAALLPALQHFVATGDLPEAAQPPLSPSEGEGSIPSNPEATQEGAQEPKEGGAQP